MKLSEHRNPDISLLLNEEEMARPLTVHKFQAIDLDRTVRVDMCEEKISRSHK